MLSNSKKPDKRKRLASCSGDHAHRLHCAHSFTLFHGDSEDALIASPNFKRAYQCGCSLDDGAPTYRTLGCLKSGCPACCDCKRCDGRVKSSPTSVELLVETAAKRKAQKPAKQGTSPGNVVAVPGLLRPPPAPKSTRAPGLVEVVDQARATAQDYGRRFATSGFLTQESRLAFGVVLQHALVPAVEYGDGGLLLGTTGPIGAGGGSTPSALRGTLARRPAPDRTLAASEGKRKVHELIIIRCEPDDTTHAGKVLFAGCNCGEDHVGWLEVQAVVDVALREARRGGGEDGMPAVRDRAQVSTKRVPAPMRCIHAGAALEGLVLEHGALAFVPAPASAASTILLDQSRAAALADETAGADAREVRAAQKHYAVLAPPAKSAILANKVFFVKGPVDDGDRTLGGFQEGSSRHHVVTVGERGGRSCSCSSSSSCTAVRVVEGIAVQACDKEGLTMRGGSRGHRDLRGHDDMADGAEGAGEGLLPESAVPQPFSEGSFPRARKFMLRPHGDTYTGGLDMSLPHAAMGERICGTPLTESTHLEAAAKWAPGSACRCCDSERSRACPCCGTVTTGSVEGLRQATRAVSVVTLNGIISGIPVVEYVCSRPSCNGSVLPYNGYHDGIWMETEDRGWLLEVLHDYGDRLETSPSPFDVYVAAINDRATLANQSAGKQVRGVLEPGAFSQAWAKFLGHSTPRGVGFGDCPSCGTEPEVILLDGTNIGAPVRLLHSIPGDGLKPSGVTKGTLKTHNVRFFFSDAKICKGDAVEEIREGLRRATRRGALASLIALLMRTLSGGVTPGDDEAPWVTLSDAAEVLAMPASIWAYAKQGAPSTIPFMALDLAWPDEPEDDLKLRVRLTSVCPTGDATTLPQHHLEAALKKSKKLGDAKQRKATVIKIVSEYVSALTTAYSAAHAGPDDANATELPAEPGAKRARSGAARSGKGARKRGGKPRRKSGTRTAGPRGAGAWEEAESSSSSDSDASMDVPDDETPDGNALAGDNSDGDAAGDAHDVVMDAGAVAPTPPAHVLTPAPLAATVAAPFRVLTRPLFNPDRYTALAKGAAEPNLACRLHALLDALVHLETFGVEDGVLCKEAVGLLRDLAGKSCSIVTRRPDLVADVLSAIGSGGNLADPVSQRVYAAYYADRERPSLATALRDVYPSLSAFVDAFFLVHQVTAAPPHDPSVLPPPSPASVGKGTVPEAWRPLFLCLAGAATSVDQFTAGFSVNDEHALPYGHLPDETRRIVDSAAEQVEDVGPEEDLRRWCYFSPSLRRRRRMHHRYENDGDSTAHGDDECHHLSASLADFTNGILVLLCEHGLVYGMQFLTQMESPRLIFNILLHRFKRVPRVVIYDNACHLASYCIMREPHLFRDTVFVSDRLHWQNHLRGPIPNCSPDLHNIDTVASVNLRGVNSEAVEQLNRLMQKIIAPQVHQMRVERALLLTIHMLILRNAKAVQSGICRERVTALPALSGPVKTVLTAAPNPKG
jgi:hypothetical protein